MMKRSCIKISSLILTTVGTLLISLAFFLPHLIDVDQYREPILAALQETLHRKVTFSHGQFSMHIGPAFSFDDVAIKEPDGSGDFISARRITLRLALLPLLEKKVVLRDMILDGAEIRLERNADGRLNVADLLSSRPGEEPVRLNRLQLRKSTLRWHDMVVHPNGLKAVASNINLSLHGLARGRKGDFKISCDLAADSGGAAKVSLSGTASLPAGAISLAETELNSELDLKQIEAGRFWPYFAKYIPFGNTGGRLDLATTFKGKLREFTAKGKLRLAGAVVNWPTVFHHPVNPRQAQLEYEIRLAGNSMDMPLIHFSADGFRIKGSCRLDDIGSPDLRISARAATEPFMLEELRQWIPYGIIAKDASEYIEEHITGGTYRLDEGVLDGRVSQIAHMEKGTNYNVLHIKGVVEKGVVSYGKNVPEFANIKAGLEMLGKDFIISRATGTFGGSPFRMEGRITDYPLDTPCQYPFQMEINPRPAEVGWLALMAGAGKLEFSGNSTLHLRGSGFIPAYNLSGDWALRQAAYAFPGAVRKPAGMSSHLTFSAILGGSETRLTSLSYNLSQLMLSATALFRYDDQPFLGFELQTNRFLLGDNLPILTKWQAYRPRGGVQAHILGSGNPRNFAAMDYSGKISLNAFSIQPGTKFRPISNINGSLAFKGNSLESSSINVRYGDSLLAVQGKLKNFSNPEAEITLSSPEFFLKDAGLTAPSPDLGIRDMRAVFSVRDNVYDIRKFSGRLNSSNFSISGIYTTGTAPEADLTINSTSLDVDDLLLLGSLPGNAATPQRSGNKPDLKLKLAVTGGKYGKLQFSGLNATITQDSGVLYLHELETGLYGGRLVAKGRIASGGAQQGSRYDLNLNLKQVQAEKILQALDVTREVTGALNLEGDITARGATLADIRKTALGNLRLRLEKGSLRKFSALSKVFSILNVSQLLKFQLPDMVSGGMPYNEIKGSIAVRDGIASTQDLFINSDAINISVLGSADIVKEELNFTIGVQPLQTVDKIVNRIPVVGWLLTGKDKAVLTAYFEARGKWSDPQVSAIPAKSMAKGVLNVFRRLFELPVRLFTDTGEVILGQ